MDDSDYSDIKRNTDADFVPNPVEGSKESLILGLHGKLSDSVIHYDTLQDDVKFLLISWLTPGVFAVGYLISHHGGVLNAFVESFEILVIFNLMTFGVYIQWFLDLGIYHRQLRAAFLAAKDLETKYAFLPPYHRMMSVQLEDKVEVGFWRKCWRSVFGYGKRAKLIQRDPVTYNIWLYFWLVALLVILGLLGAFPYLEQIVKFSNFKPFLFAAFPICILHAVCITVLTRTSKASGGTRGK